MQMDKDAWEVEYTSKAAREKKKLPEKIQILIDVQIKEIQILGPWRHDWANYSCLSDNTFHCHVKKGKPTYVVCWRLVNKKIKIVEIYYAGTHEKAPY